MHHPLLLTKFLFQKGEAALEEGTMFSPGLAVSLFQDAIEQLLWAVAGKVNAKVSDRASLEEIWKAIDLAPGRPSGFVLPAQATIITLNKARVGFKHYGIVPASREALKFQIQAEEFVTTVCGSVFAIDFRKMSQVDLLKDQRIAAFIRDALQAVRDGNAQVALEKCAMADFAVTEVFDHLIPKIPVHLGMLLLEAQGQKNESPTAPVEATVRALRNFAIAVALKVSVGDFLRFDRIVPHVFYVHGEYQTLWSLGAPPPALTIEDAEFAARYATTLAFAAETTLAGVDKAEGGSLVRI